MSLPSDFASSLLASSTTTNTTNTAPAAVNSFDEQEEESKKILNMYLQMFNQQQVDQHGHHHQHPYAYSGVSSTFDRVFPTSNYAYIGMQNDSLQAVVSNGQIDYDHSYQSTGQTPLSPLIIGSSGRQQQTQTSPGSVTVTATATQSLFDPYHSQRHSFSDCTTDSSSTCSRLSSESPRYTSESSTGTHESRFYGKLAPSSGSRYQRSSSPRSSQSSIKIARVVPLASGQRKRGRQSKDEQLASDNELPVSAFQISEMSLSELQQVLKNESLSEYQRQLIRKIRRRGKNKVAARTCRQRRTDRHDKMSHYI